MVEHSSLMTQFPSISGLSPAVTTTLDKRARRIYIDQGSVIFRPEKPAKNLLLLISGTVLIRRIFGTGRDVVLYRVHAGEACALTTACLWAVGFGYAEGVSETDIEAVQIPCDAFDDMMMTSKEFRAFVFAVYANRISELLRASEKTAFIH